MKDKYNDLVGQDVYKHIQRDGAGTPGSMDVMTASNDVFDPGDKSFVFKIIPGADGVKFSKMEEDSFRVSQDREGATYPAGVAITGRFNRLKRETGSCFIYIAEGENYNIPKAGLGPAVSNLVIREESDVVIPIYIPEHYKMFQGKDLGIIMTIHREGLDDLSDFDIGDIKVVKGTTELVTLDAFDHNNTEMLATLAEEVATYYIATGHEDGDLDSGDFLEALTDNKADAVTLALNVKEEGLYVITLKLVEMDITTNTLEKASRVLASTSHAVNVTLSDKADITAFTLPGQEGESSIDDEAGTIEIDVEYGTDVTELAATFTLSPEVSSIKVGEVDQVSGTTENDFTEPVTYLVTAEDGETTKEWTVIVTVVCPNEEAEITAFTLPGQEGDTTIDAGEGTIAIDVPYGTDVTELAATFTLSPEASVKVGDTPQVSGTTENDFTEPVTYLVTAEDGETTKEWAVTVTVLPDTEE